MTISKWMTAGTVLKMMAMQYPDKPAVGDKFRKMTFKEWNERSCRLANALAKMGVKKGDRFAILAYNCVEWMEVYAAAAKGGQITVPIMFRLAPPEMEYVVNHSECKAFSLRRSLYRPLIQFETSFPPYHQRILYTGETVKPQRVISPTNRSSPRRHLRNRM